jgi:hypothetical protein
MLDVLKDVWPLPPVAPREGGAPPFPLELVRRLVELYSAPGDLVLDPFAGTGTVGKLAKQMGRKIWLIERQSGYWPPLFEITSQSALPFDQGGQGAHVPLVRRR